MDEAAIIKDVLERLDRLTTHIIDIKSTMYRQSDFKTDEGRLYDHMGSIQAQSMSALKEAIIALESQLKDLKAEQNKFDTRLDTTDHHLIEARRPRIPGWLLAALSIAGTVIAEQMIPAIEAGLHFRIGSQ